MNWRRLIGLSLALCLHGLGLYALIARPASNGFAEGSGSDNFTVIAEVNLESADIFTQRAQEAEIDRTPAAAPPPVPENEEPKIEPQEKAQTEGPLPQQTANAAPKLAEVPPEAPREEPPAERQAVPQPATVAAKAQIEQHAAAALAAHLDELGHRYVAEFSKALERYKVKPQTTKEGDVTLQITIAPSGQLLDHTVKKSSGTPQHDRTAIFAVEHAGPFPPLPPDLSPDPLTFELTYRFRTR
jgi:protein TonB